MIEIAKQIKDKDGDRYLSMPEEEVISLFMDMGKKLELDRIKEDLAYFGCEFDSWISEKWITEQGMVEDTVKKMDEHGLLYEKDGALWFKSSEYGDEKDRVLRKFDGYYT